MLERLVKPLAYKVPTVCTLARTELKTMADPFITWSTNKPSEISFTSTLMQHMDLMTKRIKSDLKEMFGTIYIYIYFFFFDVSNFYIL